jgi:hypothetical protein
VTDEQLWPQMKAEATSVYTAANPETARLLRDQFVKRWGRKFPTAVGCFEDDFEACIAHLLFPITHPRAIRTTNLLERLFEENRRRTKVLPHAFGERPMLKLMFAAVIRAAEKWRKLKVTNFEREQLLQLREELNEQFKRRHAPAVPPAPSAFSSKCRTSPGQNFANTKLVADDSIAGYSISAQPPPRGIYATPSIGIDITGTSPRIYVAYVASGVGGGDNTDVVVRYSDENGENGSWSDPPILVHASSLGSRFHPWLRVDQDNGTVGVVFYDTRLDLATRSKNERVRAWAAVSTDEGANSTDAMLATDESDQSAENQSAYAGRYLEYIGLDIRDGTLHAAWADNRDNPADLEIYTASAAITSSGNELKIEGGDAGTTNDIIKVRHPTRTVNGTPTVLTDFIEVVFGSSEVIQYAGLKASIGSITIDGVSGNDTITIDSSLNKPVIVNVNTDGTGTNSVTFPVTTKLSALNIGSEGTVQMASGGDKVLITNSLSISGTGKLDLVDEDLFVDYTGTSPLSTIGGYLSTGYASGAWNGRGINSSTAADDVTDNTAVGYAEASDVLGATGGIFSGITVDGTAVLVKYTWYGDANLGGSVEVDDLGRLASNWQASRRIWAQGNFDYDSNSIVDVNDLGLLATNWQAGVGGPLFAGGPDPLDSFLEGIEKLELSEDEIAKLLGMLNTEELPIL